MVAPSPQCCQARWRQQSMQEISAAAGPHSAVAAVKVHGNLSHGAHNNKQRVGTGAWYACCQTSIRLWRCCAQSTSMSAGYRFERKHCLPP
jgi:hypothetical protein